jgi:hypothetical protein
MNNKEKRQQVLENVEAAINIEKENQSEFIRHILRKGMLVDAISNLFPMPERYCH